MTAGSTNPERDVKRDPLKELSRDDPFWLTFRAKRIARKLLNVYCGAVPPLGGAHRMLSRDEDGLVEHEAYHSLARLLEDPSAAQAFPRSTQEVHSAARIPVILSALYSDLEAAYDRLPAGTTEAVDLKALPRFEPSEVMPDLERSNRLLEELAGIFREHAGHFHLAVMNGSLGSGDHMPGWSDVDVFCALSADTVKDPNALADVREALARANSLAYLYNVLQLHGVFVTSEIDFRFHVPSEFPLVALHNGSMLTCSGSCIEIHCGPADMDGYIYLYGDIMAGARKLMRLKHRSPLQTTLLMHRIYAFPFAFLQCVGIQVYKRDSFDVLSSRFSGLLPDIGSFYEGAGRLYHNWNVTRLSTLLPRGMIGRLISPKRLNRYFLPMERGIIENLAQMSDWLEETGAARFQKIIALADEYLWERVKHVIDAEAR